MRKPNGMGSSFLSRFAGVPNSAPHSFFHTLSAANSTEALARIFMAAATAWSKLAGLVMVGLAGHLTTPPRKGLYLLALGRRRKHRSVLRRVEAAEAPPFREPFVGVLRRNEEAPAV